MAKSCIFCGKPPSLKTKEHVIPRWLLSLTGDPNRIANFGPKFDEPGEVRQFAYDSFHFPACKRCNDYGAQLEGRAAPLISALLDDSSLNGHQLSTLLDWLDKVRVGLWLAHSMLGKNIAKVRPQFYIQDRIRLMDRALIVYRGSPTLPPLAFAGTFGPTFQYSPVAFYLRIKHVTLVNVSFNSLCAPTLGFPNCVSGEYIALGGAIEYRITAGTGLFAAPFCSFLPPIPEGGEVFLQPIFKQLLAGNPPEAIITDHVRRFSAGMPRGAGLVFRVSPDHNLIPIPSEQGLKVVPSKPSNNRTVLWNAFEFVLDTQRSAFAAAASVGRLAPAEQEFFNAHIPLIDKFNRFMKERAEEELRTLKYI